MIGLNPKLQPKYVGPYYITDVSDNNHYELRDCSTHKPLKSRVNAERMKMFVPTTIRDIPHNEVNNEGAEDASQADDSQPQANPEPSAGPSSVNDDVPDTQNKNDITPRSTDGERLVESISKCQNYKGKKWYHVKWANQRFKVWEIEENVPEEAIRQFHVNRTQTGKAQKAKKA